VRIAELRKEQNRLNAELTRRKLWPELTLSTGAVYGSSDYLGTGLSPSENDKVTWNAMVTLNFNFLDWGVRRRNSQVANERVMIQENQIENEIFSLRTEIQNLENEIEQLQRNFKLAEELLELERTNLELISREYRQGSVQYLDYVTGLTNFSDAQTRYYTSLYELKQALLARDYHQGRIHASILGR
jgi:outer membrane protein TolC